jgi:hypothetical protein
VIAKLFQPSEILTLIGKKNQISGQFAGSRPEI